MTPSRTSERGIEGFWLLAPPVNDNLCVPVPLLVLPDV
jgi:hypothetical protein